MFRKKRSCVSATIALAAFWLASPSHGSTIAYADKATFQAATGATSASGPLPNLGGISSTALVGNLTLIAIGGHTLYIGTLGTAIGDWTSALPGNDLAVSGYERFDVQMPGPVHSFGFDIIEPTTPGTGAGTCRNPTCVDSTFVLSLYNGGTLVDQITFNPPDDVAAFVGVWSSTAFNIAKIAEVVPDLFSGASSDDEYFGQFYTGTAASLNAVPIPASIYAFAAALGTLRILRGRQRARFIQ